MNPTTTVRITKPISGGAVKAIASKSEAHRLLICAALGLGDRESFVSCPERSKDIDATARCLSAMGAVIMYERNGFRVAPISSIKTSRCVLDCGESGATMRFLLPVCAALGLSAELHMRGRLLSRPIAALYNEMVAHGCTLSDPGISPLVCEGKLQHGRYTLPGNISSQFISGMLFALPLLDDGSIIHVTGILESRPYVDMTLDALKLFGIKFIEEKNIFQIQGGQTFHSPGTVQVKGDWSNAAFWLAAGAIGKASVTCTGLDFDSRQGDRAIVELLTRCGANVTCDGDTVSVSPKKLLGMDIDARDIPDLVPILAAVASVAEGKTTVRNAKRLRMKESDRLRTVAASLSALGADITETEDGLIITGRKTLAGGETQSFGDHRIAMTAAIISAACTDQVVIRDADAVLKSYPNFFEDFNNALGGCADVVKLRK